MKEKAAAKKAIDKAEVERLDLRSHTIADDKVHELLRVFPEAHTEGGKLDFTRLRLALGDAVDAGKERYGLNWPGKAECFTTIQTPSLGTLRPARAESVNWDETENLIIEGDNLEVLKLLQKSYLSKVKIIYIDPPYNTGNDFIYPDDYTESLQTYLEYTGQIDAEGKKFSTNADRDGRFHSKWLNMMYPRLYLARNLLTEDGVILVTVDDAEVHNLRHVMNEIFGEENFLACIAWEKRYTRSNNAKMFYSLKDSILVYRKTDRISFLREGRTEKSDATYSNPDNDPRGAWTTSSYVNPATKAERPGLAYPIKRPRDGVMVEHETHAWKHSPEAHALHVQEKRLWWGQDGGAKYPRLKIYLGEADGLVPIDVWDYKSSGTTDEGGQEVKELFGGRAVFDNPKPTKLIRRMLNLFAPGEDGPIVLDFFAGSGSTAHAVIAANHEDGGKRKFILVQLPEPTPADSISRNAGFETIADVCTERVRRAIKAVVGKQVTLDVGTERTSPGFRLLRLAESNFKPWDADEPKDAARLQKQLIEHVHHLRKDRKPEDILTEILLKSGFPLTTPVETVMLGGKKVHSVAGGMLLICLERNLTLEAIRAMAERKPDRIVCLDEGFSGNDQLKANAMHTFKAKGVTSFKSV